MSPNNTRYTDKYSILEKDNYEEEKKAYTRDVNAIEKKYTQKSQVGNPLRLFYLSN